MKPSQGLTIDPFLEWKNEGEAEVERYLLALSAREIELESGSRGYSLRPNDPENSVKVSVVKSQTYDQGDSLRCQHIAQRLALVLWDNLRHQNDYGEVWLIFRDQDEIPLAEHHFPASQLRNLSPQLRGRQAP